MRFRVLAFGLIMMSIVPCMPRAAMADPMPNMGAVMTLGGRQYSLFIESDVNGRVKSFNRDIKAHGIKGHLVSCSLLIDLPVGVVNGNNSYGGYCTLVDDHGTRSRVEVCNDDMVGHFKLERPDPGDWSEDLLATFVMDNCFGG